MNLLVVGIGYKPDNFVVGVNIFFFYWVNGDSERTLSQILYHIWAEPEDLPFCFPGIF